MHDKTIPFHHIIMRVDRVLPMEVTLPEGYAIRTWQPGDDDAWAALECGIGDFATAEDARADFARRYLNNPGWAPERVFFAVSPQGEVVGSAIAWEHDERGVGTRALHWLVVREDHRRKGLGRALCQHVLRLFRREDNAAPVYLHTQPWSWPAILLYISLGFKLQPQDTFYGYENQYAPAMEALRRVVTADQLALMEQNTAPVFSAADLSAIRYDSRGLVPAIAQDARTGQVLMQAYMNAESIAATLNSGYATYYSRSRQELWCKGATSGHTQRVLTMNYDCDGDAILMQVEQIGPACHTGAVSCFHNPMIPPAPLPPSAQVIQEVYDVICDRKVNPKEGSYTNYLLAKGKEKICKKVGEEASEAIIAAMKDNPAELCGEAADLIYHLLVLLSVEGVTTDDLWAELAKRH